MMDVLCMQRTFDSLRVTPSVSPPAITLLELLLSGGIKKVGCGFIG